MKIDEIISSLKKLNLEDEPVNEIKKLIKQVGKIGYILIKFHKGKSIIRARANEDGQRFRHNKELSFKPQQYNTTYQRASTPNQTMFYGTFLPDRIETSELNNARVVGVFEAMPWLRDENSSGYKKITFGRWYVQEDINFIAIMHKDTFYQESNYTRELVDAYNDFIDQEDKEMVEKSLNYQRFLADEFSKDIEVHTDYLISAIFSEIITQNPNIDGIIYPSVRILGKGFNVAIKPEACKKIGLYVVGECSIYKRKDHIVVGIDCKVELNGKSDTFVLEDIESDREQCLQELGVNSIDELK